MRVDEKAAAFLCYTSGTTGDPKGVLYSHRSIVLHGMAAGLSSAFGFSAFDVIMPCSSMYHATAWGLPFTAAINGCKLVLPCDRMDGASLADQIGRAHVCTPVTNAILVCSLLLANTKPHHSDKQL